MTDKTTVESKHISEIHADGSSTPLKTKKTVFLINGAPNSGKDASATLLKKAFGGGSHRAFKDALYEETAKHFNVDLDWFIKQATDRTTKETPTRILFDRSMNPLVRIALFLFSLIRPVGFSPRQALIHVSENIIKPKFGNTFFGIKLLDAILDDDQAITFVSDSGFESEIEPLVEAGLKVHVIRLHREGCTFEGDSRSLLSDETLNRLGVTFKDVYNDGTLEDLEKKLTNAACDLLVG